MQTIKLRASAAFPINSELAHMAHGAIFMMPIQFIFLFSLFLLLFLKSNFFAAGLNHFIISLQDLFEESKSFRRHNNTIIQLRSLEWINIFVNRHKNSNKNEHFSIFVQSPKHSPVFLFQIYRF